MPSYFEGTLRWPCRDLGQVVVDARFVVRIRFACTARASVFRMLCPEPDNSTGGARGCAPGFSAVKMFSPEIKAGAAGHRGVLQVSQFAPQPEKVFAIAAQSLANVEVGCALQPAVEQSAHRFQRRVQLKQRTKLLAATGDACA